MKKCIDCKTRKNLSEFYPAANQCKVCLKNKKRTYEGVARQIYREQKRSCKKRPKTLPTYSETQFVSWFKTQPNSKAIYNTWVANNYAKDFRPSADRLDNTKSYTLGNLELVTWKENCSRGYRDVRNGSIQAQHIPILQYTQEGILIAEHKSIKLGADSIGVTPPTLRNAIYKLRKNGKPRLSGGYVWKRK